MKHLQSFDDPGSAWTATAFPTVAWIGESADYRLWLPGRGLFPMESLLLRLVRPRKGQWIHYRELSIVSLPNRPMPAVRPTSGGIRFHPAAGRSGLEAPPEAHLPRRGPLSWRSFGTPPTVSGDARCSFPESGPAPAVPPGETRNPPLLIAWPPVPPTLLAAPRPLATAGYKDSGPRHRYGRFGRLPAGSPPLESPGLAWRCGIRTPNSDASKIAWMRLSAASVMRRPFGSNK